MDLPADQDKVERFLRIFFLWVPRIHLTGLWVDLVRDHYPPTRTFEAVQHSARYEDTEVNVVCSGS